MAFYDVAAQQLDPPTELEGGGLDFFENFWTAKKLVKKLKWCEINCQTIYRPENYQEDGQSPFLIGDTSSNGFSS